MRWLLTLVTLACSTGCLVITAADVQRRDDLTGTWIGEYALPDGATGALALEVEDSEGTFSGLGVLDDGEMVYVGDLRGSRGPDEFYFAFHGEDPHWFDVRLQGPMDLDRLRGTCGVAGFDLDGWGEFVARRAERTW